MEKLHRAGFGGQVVLMQSSGGVMPPQSVQRRAVALLGSGPTGGVMGAALAAGRSGVHDFVAADMGGTSYDVCLVQHGQPAVATDWNWRHRYYVNLPMVDIHSVGAGGGSIARVRQGALLVGPDSAGSVPGPVCYGRGGDAGHGHRQRRRPRLPARQGLRRGRMELDVEAGRAAIARDVADPLGLDVDDAAWAIQRIVNANMANAVRKVLSQHGADPRTLSLVAYGGGGPVHAWAQARELGIGRVLVPKASPAFSALGLLVSDYVVDLMRAYVVKLSDIDLSRVRALAAEMHRRGGGGAGAGAARARAPSRPTSSRRCVTTARTSTCSVPLPEGESLSEEHLLDLADRFHHQHEAGARLRLPDPAAARARYPPGAPRAPPRSRPCWPAWAR